MIAIVQSARNQFSVIVKNTLNCLGFLCPYHFKLISIKCRVLRVAIGRSECVPPMSNLWVKITKVIVILQRLLGLQWPTISALIVRSLSSELPFHFTFHTKCSQQHVIWLSVKSWSPCYPDVLAKIILPEIGKPWKSW